MAECAEGAIENGRLGDQSGRLPGWTSDPEWQANVIKRLTFIDAEFLDTKSDEEFG
jgi:hypothetical protein